MAERPQFVNLATGESITAPVTPPEAGRGTRVTYARPQGYGASGPRHNYVGTEALTLRPLSFLLTPETADEVREHDRFLAFLEALLYPSAEDFAPAVHGPAEVLFVWPGWVSILGRVTALDENVTAFWDDGRPKVRTITVSLEEVGAAGLTAERVTLVGARRGGNALRPVVARSGALLE